MLCELIKTMLADEVIAGQHECLHATQSLAHPRVSPSSGSRHEPLATYSPRAGEKEPTRALPRRLLPPCRAGVA